MNTIANSKAQWRAQLRAGLANISPAQRENDSAKVVERIMNDERWRSARNVLLFIPLKDEVNVLSLVDRAIHHRKNVFLPRFNKESGTYEAAAVSNLTMDLVPGRFGVAEPVAHASTCSLKQLDVTLVPGLGFDRVGRRLGRGKGYYDRLLADASGVFWGTGLDCQLVPELPGEPHDVVLNSIITPAHWIEVVSARR